MQSLPPIDTLKWDLFSPFRRVRCTAEFSYADKSMKGGKRRCLSYNSAYDATRYSETVKVSSLSLSSRDFIILTHADYDRNLNPSAGKILLSYPHIPTFLRGMEEAISLFAESSYEPVDDNGIFRLSTERNAARYHKVTGLYGNASIMFEPTIIPMNRDDDSDSDHEEIGERAVKMYLNSRDHYGVASLDEFISYEYFMGQLNLFFMSQSAMTIALSRGIFNPGSSESYKTPTANRPKESGGEMPSYLDPNSAY